MQAKAQLAEAEQQSQALEKRLAEAEQQSQTLEMTFLKKLEEVRARLQTNETDDRLGATLRLATAEQEIGKSEGEVGTLLSSPKAKIAAQLSSAAKHDRKQHELDVDIGEAAVQQMNSATARRHKNLARIFEVQ